MSRIHSWLMKSPRIQNRSRSDGLKRNPLCLMPLERRVAPAVFTVTSLADTATPGTLRQAVADANGNGAGLDTIAFNIPAGGTITLVSELTITGSVLIDGPSAFDIIVSGNNATRLFNVGKRLIDQCHLRPIATHQG